MSNKLKTLKDITSDSQGYFNELDVSREKLKEEAIKHIKHRERCIKKSIESIGDYEEVINWDEGAKEGLMTFFNLTEEDLN